MLVDVSWVIIAAIVGALVGLVIGYFAGKPVRHVELAEENHPWQRDPDYWKNGKHLDDE